MALFALTSIIFWVNDGSKSVVLWAWDVVVWAFFFASAVWTSPAVTASIVTDVFWGLGLAVAYTSWFSFTAIPLVDAFCVVTSDT